MNDIERAIQSYESPILVILVVVLCGGCIHVPAQVKAEFAPPEHAPSNHYVISATTTEAANAEETGE